MAIEAPSTTQPLLQSNESPQTSAAELSAQAKPYETMTNKELVGQLLTHSKAIDLYKEDRFSTHTLKQLSQGTQANGTDATPEQKDLAKELMKRPELLDYLDLSPNGGVEDGQITWDAVAAMAGEPSRLSDRGLLMEAKRYHQEFDSTGNGYVNFKELKEAAGLLPSDRTFSEGARQTARELLKRPSLLKTLDIGVGFLGLPGKQDERYDVTNLDHTIAKSSRTHNHPFRSKTD